MNPDNSQPGETNPSIQKLEEDLQKLSQEAKVETPVVQPTDMTSNLQNFNHEVPTKKPPLALAIFLLIITSLALIFYLFKDRFLGTAIVSSPKPKVFFTATPIPPSPLLNNLPKHTFEFCGSSLPTVKFSLNPPMEWSSKPTDGSEIYQTYRYEGSEGWLDVTCGDGFGGGCDSQYKTTVEINGSPVTGCYSKAEGKAFLSATYISSPKREVTFSFTSNLSNKKLLNNILSTFKFLGVTPSANPTVVPTKTPSVTPPLY